MRRLLPCLLLVLVAFGCHREPSTPPDVIVRAGDRMLTLADFRRYLDRNTGADLAQMNPEVASALLDQWVEEIVLSEYAATHGVEVPAETIAAAVRNEAGSTVIEKRDEMRRQKLISDLSTEVPEPSDAEVQAYYDQHQPEFRSGEEIHVRQILVHDEDLANQIVARLKKGEKFEDLSAQYSLAANAKKGGDIGYVSRGELPRLFEDVIFALAPGQVSQVIGTESTFHVFRVDDKRPPGQTDLQTAAPVIRQRLHEEGVRDRISGLLTKIRKEAQISVLTRRLPFKYAGTLPKSENE
jgi:peptidyl-prolyl cis-trans isomerase C